MEANNVIKLPMEEKYIRAVVKGCAERGVQVSEELASVFYGSLILNPNVNANLLNKPIGNKTVRILEHCINRLSIKDDTIILCVKMQLLLERDYKNKEFVINKINEEIDRRMKPLLNAILDNINTTDEETSVHYQRIVQYIILKNYMGNPTSLINIRETSAALNNVMSKNKLLDFENQLPFAKEKQLKEMSNLVCGIRLYKDRKVCQEEIFDMIDTLPSAVNLLLQNIDQDLEDVSKRVAIITLWLRQCYKVDKDFLAPIFAIRIRLASVKVDDLNEYKRVLVFYLQYQKNLEKIKRDLSECNIESLDLTKKYDTTLKEIRHVLTNVHDFDEAEVFPKLIEISAIWNKMMEMMNYLSITTNLIVTMKQMTIEIKTKESVENIQSGSIFPNINEEEQQKIIEKHPLHPMCKWYPRSSNIIDRSNLFASGYCVVTIVETDGVLIEYNQNLGIIHYSDKWFGFSCMQAAIQFGNKPSYYLNCFYNLLRYQTHLLFFFHLYEQLAEKQYVPKELMREKYNCIKYKDAQVQTGFYPNANDTNLVLNDYIHNRSQTKQTFYQDNTKKMVNQSAQTLDVYKSVHVQTASNDVGCNTMSEKGTNTSMQLVFGQRGH